MAHGSKKAVITAILANGIVTVIKFFAAALSGSAAMMNEAVHSLMDTLNQAFLLLGLREAHRPPDLQYAFGHGQKKYLWNLWSAIGLFSIGAGLGLAHAWHAWHQLGHTEEILQVELLGHSIDALWLNMSVLGIALLLEGYSFLVALKAYLQRMREAGMANPFAYLLKADDPTLVAVVLEDSVAMLGLIFAALGVGLSAITGQAEWDIAFSVLIAITLGLIAFYLGWTNMRFLADMRDTAAEAVFTEVAASHHEVERTHNLRSIILDENNTLLVAQVELREEAMVPGLYEQIEQRRQALFEAAPSQRRHEESLHQYVSARASVEATLARTEQIIDELTLAIKAKLPRVNHVTIEVEGISSPTET